jgi:poly-gamma-glutamate synthesis protein (capsule biosynthesis protein)
LNDYEGIAGHEQYRGDLSLAYFPTLDTASGELIELRIVPMRMSRFSLHDVSLSDTEWLTAMLTREGERFSTSAARHDGHIALGW